MKIIIVLTVIFCGVTSVYSQTDSVFLKEYEGKILENSKLKTDLQTEKQKFSDLSGAYRMDTLALQKQIKDLCAEIASEKQKVADLNKNKVKEERDKLQTKIDSLNAVILKQSQAITDKDKQIANEIVKAKAAAHKAKNDGKTEALASIVNSYRTSPFDDLIKSSTKESVSRDMQLVGNDPEIKSILNDLQIYFTAQELLSEKCNSVRIETALEQLVRLNQQSKLLDTLKEDLEYYLDFHSALKKTIEELINLDKRTSADGDIAIQKLKYNTILTILADYMYNYYDYPRYPFLNSIILEIIKLKHANADSDITGLLLRL